MRRKVTGVVAAASAMSLLGSGLAFGDSVTNTVDTTVDAVAEVMPLTVGGGVRTTTLYVLAENGDNRNGCNLNGSNTATITISSADPAKATVSPSEMTFQGCGDQHAQTVTVTPVAAGDSTISVTGPQTVRNGTITYNTATFIARVAAAANTAPTVSVTGVTAGAAYNKGSVPAAGCSVTDAEDGPSTFPATLSAVTGTYASDGLGSQTASCSYRDGGGLTATSSATYGIVDPSAPSVGSALNPLAPDGSNGWYKGNVGLTWNVSEPESPNSLSKTGCVNQNVTADQVATDYRCSASSAGGSATEQTVTIKRDGTGPVISGVDVNDSTWRNTDLSSDYTASDATSDLANPADASFTLTASDESESESVPTRDTKTVTDNAGNSSTRTVSALIDKTDPDISGADVANTTWRNTPLSASYTASDAKSGLANAADASFSLTASAQSTLVEGVVQPTSDSKTVADTAGNSSTRNLSALIDLTDPVITSAGRVSEAAPNAAGWYTAEVTNRFDRSDALSGLAVGSSATEDVRTGTVEGDAVTVTSSAVSDKAGNSAPGIRSAAYKIDLSNPTDVQFVGGPAAGSTEYFGSVSTAPTCTATDAVSGIASCVVTGHSTAVGSHTMTATATDIAGRTATATRSYTVSPWDFRGFYQPVDMSTATTTVYNTVKAGSTVPIKFEVFKGSTELTNTAAIKPLTSALITCSGTAGVDDVELLATGGTSLRYDATGGQYVYNWQTPKTIGSCYKVTITSQDGSSKTAFFKTK